MICFAHDYIFNLIPTKGWTQREGNGPLVVSLCGTVDRSSGVVYSGISDSLVSVWISLTESEDGLYSVCAWYSI